MGGPWVCRRVVENEKLVSHVHPVGSSIRVRASHLSHRTFRSRDMHVNNDVRVAPSTAGVNEERLWVVLPSVIGRPSTFRDRSLGKCRRASLVYNIDHTLTSCLVDDRYPTGMSLSPSHSSPPRSGYTPMLCPSLRSWATNLNMQSFGLVVYPTEHSLRRMFWWIHPQNEILNSFRNVVGSIRLRPCPQKPGRDPPKGPPPATSVCNSCFRRKVPNYRLSLFSLSPL
jgi:hypothetical protein